MGENWLLRNVVKMLRRKMWNEATSPKYIIIEPRVGYRMAMRKEHEGPSPSSSATAAPGGDDG